MPAIEINEIHPNGGSVWQRAVQIWEQYVVEDTWTLAASCVFHAGLGTVLMQVDDGTDVTSRYLIMGDALDGSVLASGWWSQAGWRYMPGAKLATYGARNTQANWLAKMVELRRSMYGFFAAASAVGTLLTDDLALPLESAVVKISHWVWQERMTVGTDTLCCPVYTPSATYEWYADRVGNEGVLPDGSVSIVAGGGGSAVDLGPLTTALEDIAAKEISYSYNSNGSVFNSTARMFVGP